MDRASTPAAVGTLTMMANDMAYPAAYPFVSLATKENSRRFNQQAHHSDRLF
jgi:hypothetical protein